jgi:CRP/FNR family transcriptional regulator, cyclic AMP receptor protein
MPAVERARRSTLRSALAVEPILDGVPAATAAALAAEGNFRGFARGTFLFHQGDEAPDVCFLLEGRLEVSATSPAGHRTLITLLEPTCFLGYFAVVGDIPRTASVLAIEDSVVWAIPAEAFLGFLMEEPLVARGLLRALVRQISVSQHVVEDLLFLDLKGRVAKRLLQVVSPSLEELATDGATFPSSLTQEDFASLCGGSRENVSRIMSEFARRGLVRKDDRRWVVTDVAALARIADL